MDKKEELLAYFESEITEVSKKEITALEQEIEEIRNRTLQELTEQAQQRANAMYEQELSELKGDHAIALSHLNDDNSRRLMAERDRLVDSVFATAKERILSFTKQTEYLAEMKQKLCELQKKEYPSAHLSIAVQDEAYRKELLAAYGRPCSVEVDPLITLGGFRLACKEAGIIHDETYDTAIAEAREWFHEASGLTIR